MKVYFESDYFVVKYSTAIHAVVNKWITAPTSVEFREGMETLLQAMIYYKAGKIVSDTTYLGTLLQEDQEWAASHWYRRAVEAGFSHNAIIIPANLFTEMSVYATLDSIEENVTTIRYFDAMEDAMVWIKHV
ncbi:hypothetical protein ACFQ21_10495 [Ohtaekwangia kribbensis]|jgi:hypothetical protein|uniref:STAS/SEC14 domain-containing protein n=1 Tax=Ohtaekwangia kribbensis TaxID=688913 RepID=A0ABW3K166_9BACT